jgi:hypothetical protein
MRKIPRFIIFIVVFMLVGLTCLTVSAQVVNATTLAPDKAGAIQAANVAINKLYLPAAYEQTFVQEVANARALVTHAKSKGATDADITGLTKLVNAENLVKRFAAILTARDAIDKIPPTAEITSADRGKITEARRLVNIAMSLGASQFDICWRYDTLVAAEKAANLSNVLSGTALPATGAFSVASLIGTLLAGTGALISVSLRKKRL